MTEWGRGQFLVYRRVHTWDEVCMLIIEGKASLLLGLLIYDVGCHSFYPWMGAKSSLLRGSCYEDVLFSHVVDVA